MNGSRLATLARLTRSAPSRRDILRGLAGAGLGLSVARLGAAVEAKQKRKHKRKERKPTPNAFGCLDVGQPCRGDDGTCCSGICEGEKPRKGKKDTSRCAAHDSVTCQPGERETQCGGAELVLCTTSTGFAGQCNTTTGNAGFCLASGVCFSCVTDAECQQVCGARAACLQCTDCVQYGGTMCGSPDDVGCSAM